MIDVNSKFLTIPATVTCPLAFPDWGTVETVVLLMAGTVDIADTVQNSGWC